MKEYDSLLEGLKDDAEDEATTSAEDAPEGDAGGEGGASEQRGKRADPDYVQVNANIPRELRASLFFYLKQEGRSLSGLVEELLEEYVEERGGIIAPKKPGKRKRSD